MSRPTQQSVLRGALLLALVWLSAGCGEESAPAAQAMTGQLDLEIRDSAKLTIEPSGGVSLEVSAGYGLLEANTKLVAPGRIERLAESSATLYTARFSVPAQNGLCKAEPISLALSLHRQGDNARVLGGLSAYCGADTWFGAPVRVLRLSGSLPVH